MIVPESFLAYRVSADVYLRSVQTCRDLVRSLADFAPRMRRPWSPRETLPLRANRFDGLSGYVLLPEHRPSDHQHQIQTP